MKRRQSITRQQRARAERAIRGWNWIVESLLKPCLTPDHLDQVAAESEKAGRQKQGFVRFLIESEKAWRRKQDLEALLTPTRPTLTALLDEPPISEIRPEDIQWWWQSPRPGPPKTEPEATPAAPEKPLEAEKKERKRRVQEPPKPPPAERMTFAQRRAAKKAETAALKAERAKRETVALGYLKDEKLKTKGRKFCERLCKDMFDVGPQGFRRIWNILCGKKSTRSKSRKS